MSPGVTSPGAPLNLNKQERVKKAVGSFLMKNIQREARNVNAEHLKILSDFNIPLHKYNQFVTEEQRTSFLLDHMVAYIRNLMG
jgi:hypothetical protein